MVGSLDVEVPDVNGWPDIGGFDVNSGPDVGGLDVNDGTLRAGVLQAINVIVINVMTDRRSRFKMEILLESVFAFPDCR